MARLVIRISPNDHPTDSSLTPLRTAVGDVVEIVDDGHQFSKAELTNGQYRIIDVPGVSQEALVHLKAHVEDVNGNMIQRRNVNFPLATLRNVTWRNRTSATKAQIDGITITKTRVASDGIIA